MIGVTALVVAAGLVLGAVLHEIAHAVAAAALAEAWQFRWREPATYATYPDEEPWRRQVVALAPMVAGLGWLVGLAWTAGAPDGVRAWPWIAAVTMTVGGGLDEFAFDEDSDQAEEQASRAGR